MCNAVTICDSFQESLDSEMAQSANMVAELESLREMKKDLNETCLISEDRMIAAEKAFSVLKKQHETDAEAHGKQVKFLSVHTE